MAAFTSRLDFQNTALNNWCCVTRSETL